MANLRKSLATTTSNGAPFETSLGSLSGIKETLRHRSKNITPICLPRQKVIRKSRLQSFGIMKPNDECEEKNWIMLNIKLGIYKNWLKLAQYFREQIISSKKQKAEWLQKFRKKVEEERESLMEIVRKRREEKKEHQPKWQSCVQSKTNETYTTNMKENQQFCDQILYSIYLLGSINEKKFESLDQFMKKGTVQKGEKNVFKMFSERDKKTVQEIVEEVDFLKRVKMKNRNQSIEELRRKMRKPIENDRRISNLISTVKNVLIDRGMFKSQKSLKNLDEQKFKGRYIKQNGNKKKNVQKQINSMNMSSSYIGKKEKVKNEAKIRNGQGGKQAGENMKKKEKRSKQNSPLSIKSSEAYSIHHKNSPRVLKKAVLKEKKKSFRFNQIAVNENQIVQSPIKHEQIIENEQPQSPQQNSRQALPTVSQSSDVCIEDNLSMRPSKMEILLQKKMKVQKKRYGSIIRKTSTTNLQSEQLTFIKSFQNKLSEQKSSFKQKEIIVYLLKDIQSFGEDYFGEEKGKKIVKLISNFTKKRPFHTLIRSQEELEENFLIFENENKEQQQVPSESIYFYLKKFNEEASSTLKMEQSQKKKEGKVNSQKKRKFSGINYDLTIPIRFQRCQKERKTEKGNQILYQRVEEGILGQKSLGKEISYMSNI